MPLTLFAETFVSARNEIIHAEGKSGQGGDPLAECEAEPHKKNCSQACF